jgi:hypothetical protein
MLLMRSIRAAANHRKRGRIAGAWRRLGVPEMIRNALPAWFGERVWTKDLRRAATDLDQLNRSTESHFLAVGEKLMGFVSAARQIQTEFTGLAGLVSGEEGNRSCEVLRSVLDRAELMQRRAQSTLETLASLGDSSRRLRREFSGFTQTVLSFRVTATLARIEAARVRQSEGGLFDLADDVRSYSDTIESRIEQVLATTAMLESRILDALQVVSQLNARELSTLPSLIATVEANLQAFRVRRQEATVASTKLASRFGLISDAVSNVVTSIQAHDITRQQIEHVVQALNAVIDRAGSSSRLPLEEAAVIDVQRAQIAAASATFGQAVAQIHRDLVAISTEIREVAEEGAHLLGRADGERNSFFTDMERGFKAILNAVSECEKLENDTADLTCELGNTVVHLRGAVADIQTIELEIRRLSLNARIRAIHLGGSGEPLNVIAEAMQELGAECEARSRACQHAIDYITGAIPPIRQVEVSDRSIPFAGDAASDDLQSRINQLQASSSESLMRGMAINTLASGLCEEVASVREGFTEDQVLADTVAGCSVLLEKVTRDTNSPHPASSPVSGRPMQDVVQNYTMRGERDIHEAVARGVDSASLAEETPLTAGALAQQEFGENVELF